MEKQHLPHNHGEHKNINFIEEELKNANNFMIVSEIFKQLSDTTRLKIFWVLCHMEECVINISAMLKISSPAVSHHLRELKTSGLVVSRRVGKEVYYHASDTEEVNILHKMIETIMEIVCPKDKNNNNLNLSQYDTIEEVHEYLTQHLDERITIDELSKKFLMNPTTLKINFKNVYGSSLASHIKEHRMEKAAELLRETEDSILDISKKVGYENQSKFSENFKDFYKMLPTEYRRLKRK